ncbi:hypothetical protein [Stieleria varia]|uniref:Uncharacterized protein n=1 Tax=Stieleria varia TaxID=2528005 RepID=A0A5C6A6G7_9BACT|nr:hypothetical protein [Stieleria varia]TWT93933.1 hypothetical protein Pla52n_57610 [Stieleria varia]
MKPVNCLYSVILISLVIISGCSKSDEPTVIQPTENYQPTAEEQQAQEAMQNERE